MAEKNRRVMLKLSGEALAGEKHFGFDDDTIRAVAQEVKTAVDAGVQLAIVIGGGNFWRGRQSELHLCFRDFPDTGHEDEGDVFDPDRRHGRAV